MLGICHNIHINIVGGVQHPTMTRKSFLKKPNKDANLQRIPFLLSPTDLQRKILLHLCTTENATYESLIKEIERDRTTILESIESLIRHDYVEKERVNPEHPKSMLIFAPTLRGVATAWSFFGFDVKDMINIKKEDEITKYLEFVRNVFSFPQQIPMLSRLFNTIERDYLKVQEEGSTTKKRLVKESFTNGIFELMQQENYDVSRLFNNNSNQWLHKLYSQVELRGLKEFFVRTEKNLISTIKKFPV